MMSDIRVGRGVQDSPQNRTSYNRTRLVGRSKMAKKRGTSHNDRVYYIQLVEHIKLMLHGNCTRQCIRNKTFLFVKIES